MYGHMVIWAESTPPRQRLPVQKSVLQFDTRSSASRGRCDGFKPIPAEEGTEIKSEQGELKKVPKPIPDQEGTDISVVD